MNLPILYKKTSTGKIQMWKIEVLSGNPEAYGSIVTTYGLLDGKKQQAREIIQEGKNIGKANQTSAFEQAQLEAKSQWEKKSKKGYVQNIEDAEEKKIDATFITGGVEPMLAHSYDKQGHKIIYPAYMQPKLDGHRCIAIYENGRCTLWSRTRKRITGVPHIERQIEALLSQVDFDEPVVLDGELYNHEYRNRFEELTSFIRQETPKHGHEIVQYWIYDIVVDAPFSMRLALLEQLKELCYEDMEIGIIGTTEVGDEDEAMRVFDVYMTNGFEGGMIRNANGIYKHKRSYDLQKIKTMLDSEFTVIAIEEGRGKMAGKALFVCKLDNGETFRVKMMGALDDLAVYYQEADKWIGKQLTVKYQGLSAYGVPRFPVAMRFRTEI
jgi:DNA ligase-1